MLSAEEKGNETPLPLLIENAANVKGVPHADQARGEIRIR